MNDMVYSFVNVSWDNPGRSAPGLSSGFSSGKGADPAPEVGSDTGPAICPSRRAAELRKITGGDPVTRPGTLDPYAIARDFPDRWRAYLHAHFRNPVQCAAAFEVCEKTARKWWEATNGVNGRYVAVAVRLHPQTAPAMLFAAA